MRDRGGFHRLATGHSSAADHAARTRALDGYHTPRAAVDALVAAERLCGRTWEPANGYSRISRVLRVAHGHEVFASDVHRWHRGTEAVRDFRECRVLPRPFRRSGCDVITNPPFVLAREFAETALGLLHRGDKCCLLLRLQFLEGIRRLSFYRRYPPVRVHVFSYRLPMMHRFGYEGDRIGASAMAFAWFVWRAGHEGPTELRWLERAEDDDGLGGRDRGRRADASRRQV